MFKDRVICKMLKYDSYLRCCDGMTGIPINDVIVFYCAN